MTVGFRRLSGRSSRNVRNKDIFRLSTGLALGYTLGESAIDLADEHTFAGSVPADAVTLHPVVGDAAVADDPMTAAANLLLSSYLTGPKVNTLCLLNAANSVELSTLLVATSDTEYNPELTEFEAERDKSYDVSAPGAGTYGTYMIYAGALLHTVVVAGYGLPEVQPNEEPSN